MSFSISLALIHNNNELRNSHIRSNLNSLILSLNLKFLAEKFEISYQPEVHAHGLVFAFLRDIVYKLIALRWERYRSLSFYSSLKSSLAFSKFIFKKYFLDRTSKVSVWRKNSAIEVMVTAKHIRAWERFLESNSDFLICFEDDAVFSFDSSQKIVELISDATKFNCKDPCYIDLAGGCQISELEINLLEESRDFFYRYYKKPVTNTACAYLVNRALVVSFYSILLRRPWLRLIGIDWMMNSLFMQFEQDGLKCFCMHADPVIVKHGTTTGEYRSWQVGNVRE